MPAIELETLIKNSSIEIVFDLIRSIDLHQLSTAKTNERAIRGRTSGLIELGETVTWRAKHMGFYQELTSVITDFDRPTFFADDMQEGIFKNFRHEHYLEKRKNDVVVKDVFRYTAPLGLLGRLADILFLKKYMTRFLMDRNKVIKEVAESGEWKTIIDDTME